MSIDINSMSSEEMLEVLKDRYNLVPTEKSSEEEIRAMLQQQIEADEEDDLRDVEVIEDDFNDEDFVDETETEPMNPTHPEWTQYILSEMTDDEKVNGHPTTDGLRRITNRIFGQIIQFETEVVDAPKKENERRATVVVTITVQPYPEMRYLASVIEVSGAADVYWGNTDKPYVNYPVATAETRAEGRALRKLLQLSKVVVAEELGSTVDHDYEEHETLGNDYITAVQINFLDTMGKRCGINVVKLVNNMFPTINNYREVKYDDFRKLQNKLTDYQRDINSIPDELKGYNPNWRS